MKLKKTLKLGILSLAMVQPLLAPFARAEDTRNTGGGVGFRRGTGITKPIHPGPGKKVQQPVTPSPDSRPERAGTGNALTIDFASEFEFETERLLRETEVYHARPQQLLNAQRQPIITPNFVQVTDRRGTAEGWTLQLQKTSQFYNENNQPLRGTGLFLQNPVVVSSSPANQPRAPAIVDHGAEPAIIIAQADAGSGTGTTTVRWGSSLVETDLLSQGDEGRKSYLNPDVQLFVPGGTNRKNYTYQAKLTWILSEIPGN